MIFQAHFLTKEREDDGGRLAGRQADSWAGGSEEGTVGQGGAGGWWPQEKAQMPGRYQVLSKVLFSLIYLSFCDM